eukprot:gene239-318_t
MNNPYFKLIRIIWHYGVPWRGTIVKYYIAYIIAQAIRNLSPYAFGKTIDILQNFSPGRLGEVVYWLSVGGGVILFYWMIHGPTRVIERNIALQLQQAFQLNMYEKLTALPLEWHQEHHSGNIVARINRASEALFEFAEDQFIYIQTIVTFFTSIGFLLWISPTIGALSLLSSIIVMYTVIWFDRKLTRLYNTQNEIENKISAILFDYLNNMTTVLTLRLGKLTHRNLAQGMKAIWPTFKRDIVINEVKWFTMEMLLQIAQALLLIGYITYTLRTTGAVMIGIVIMIFRYQWEISSVFNELSIHYSRLVHMNTDIEGIEPLLKDIEKLSATLKVEKKLAHEWHTIQIKDLYFQHNKARENQSGFQNVNFKIKRGEKIALIGLSGGGKSTLFKLLSGLYIPSQVNLLIDQVSFDTLDPLRSIATLIPQDPEIFENTVDFNITMGLPYEPTELEHIIKLSGFTPVLDKLPAGLDTYIREKGFNLSVGQKQRLALARGLFAARHSSLILMDEPTSSLDLPTEKEIFSDVMQNFSNTTMIISIHRLHLLPLFSRIIMLDKQGIVADGPAEELLSQPGAVHDLWKKHQAHSENEGMIGNLFEWFDFALFGYFSPLIGKLFFPSDTPTIELISAFGVFAAGFLIRPIGGIIFGHIGDRSGRKHALVLTTLLMAIPTAVIGCLPTYEQVGLIAPILLVVMRMLQGLSMGGNYGGSITFTAEHIDRGNRGLIGSFAVASCLLGIMFGSGIAALFTYLFSEESLYSWGWRLPFFLGIFICFIGFYMRRNIPESPEYLTMQNEGKIKQRPMMEIFTKHWHTLMSVVLIVMLHDISFYMLFVYMASYLSEVVGLTQQQSLAINTLNLIVVSLVTVISAWLSDKIGRKTVLAISATLFIVGTIPLLIVINSSPHVSTILMAQMALAIAVGGYLGPVPAFMVESFPIAIRFSAISITTNISGPLFGGTVPLLITYLVNKTGSHLVPAYYLTAGAIFSLLSLAFFKIKEEGSKADLLLLRIATKGYFRLHHGCLKNELAWIF